LRVCWIACLFDGIGMAFWVSFVEADGDVIPKF
jgi:hypothetical protein